MPRITDILTGVTDRLIAASGEARGAMAEEFSQFMHQLASADRYDEVIGGSESLVHVFGGRSHQVERRENIRQSFAGYNDFLLGALQFVAKFSAAPHLLTDSASELLNIPPELRTHFTDNLIGVQLVSAGLAHLDPAKIQDPARHRELHTGLASLKNFLQGAVMDLSQLFLGHGALLSTMIEAVGNQIFEGGEDKINFYRIHVNMTTINEMDHTGGLGTTYLQVVAEWLRSKGFTPVQNPENTTFLFLGTDTKVKAAMHSFNQEIKTIMRDRPGVPDDLFEMVEPQAHISRRSLRVKELPYYAIRSAQDLKLFRPVLMYGLESHERDYYDLMERESGLAAVGTYLEGFGFKKDEVYYAKTLDAMESLAMNSDRVKDKSLVARDVLEARYWQGSLRFMHGFMAMRGLKIEAIKQSKDYVLQKKLEAMIIQGLLQFLKELAAQATYFEKETEPAQMQTLYGDELLPTGDQPHKYEKWLGYLGRSAGFVGPAVYDPSWDFPDLAEADDEVQLEAKLFGLREDMELPSEVDEILRLVPRRSRYMGYLFHNRFRSQGGALQKLEAVLGQLRFASTDDLPSVMERLALGAAEFSGIFEKIHHMAATSERNPWEPRRIKYFDLLRGQRGVTVEADFARERVNRMQSDHMAVMEIDSFKAFNEAHPTPGFTDRFFNWVKMQISVVAKKMGMQRPIVVPRNGDQITIHFKQDPGLDPAFDPAVEFCKQIQKHVRELFPDKPFQDLQKVSMVFLPLQVDVPAEARLQNPLFMETVFRRLRLKAVPYVDHVDLIAERRQLTLAYPVADEDIHHIDVPSILNELQALMQLEDGIPHRLKLAGAPKIDKKRLKIWQMQGSEGQQLAYAHRAPEGYEPFMRNLTVSIALGDYEAVKDSRTSARADKVEDELGIRLGAIKDASLPHKQAFGDYRTRKPDPSPEGGPGKGNPAASENLADQATSLSGGGSANSAGASSDASRKKSGGALRSGRAARRVLRGTPPSHQGLRAYTQTYRMKPGFPLSAGVANLMAITQLVGGK